MEPVSRQIEIPRMTRLIKVSQYVHYSGDLICSNTAEVTALKQASQSLMAKRS